MCGDDSPLPSLMMIARARQVNIDENDVSVTMPCCDHLSQRSSPASDGGQPVLSSVSGNWRPSSFT